MLPPEAHQFGKRTQGSGTSLGIFELLKAPMHPIVVQEEAMEPMEPILVADHSWPRWFGTGGGWGRLGGGDEGEPVVSGRLGMSYF
jgi:hypothetical protein